MRQHQSILFGTTGFKVIADKNVFSYVRVRKGNPGYLVAANLSPDDVTVDLTGMDYLSTTGTVHIRSVHPDREGDKVKDGEEGDDEDVGKYVSFEAVPLLAKEAIVVTFVPDMNNKREAPVEEEEAQE